MNNAIPLLRLKRQESDKVTALLGAITAVADGAFEQFQSQCSAQATLLSAQVDGVASWVERVRDFGVGVISGVEPPPNLPPTPHTHDEAPLLPMAEAAVGVVGALFGQLYVFADKLRAGHIHDVYFVEGDANTQLGSGNSHLKWHVEDGCHPARPDWVILYCLRGGRGVTTYFARADDLRFDDQAERQVRTVDVPLYLDESFAAASDLREPIYSGPIIFEEDGVRAVIFDPAFSDLSTPHVAEVVRSVSEMADRVKMEWTLASGELLVFNNRRLVHARSSFDANGEDADRWIKRALVTTHPSDCNWLSPGVAANA